MTIQDFKRKSPLAIFLSYFKNHKKLFDSIFKEIIKCQSERILLFCEELKD